MTDKNNHTRCYELPLNHEAHPDNFHEAEKCWGCGSALNGIEENKQAECAVCGELLCNECGTHSLITEQLICDDGICETVAVVAYEIEEGRLPLFAFAATCAHAVDLGKSQKSLMEFFTRFVDEELKIN